MLRRLEALLVVADLEHSFLLSGSGELIEPDDGIVAVGSGGNYALAAARALLTVDGLSARDIVQRSLDIAAAAGDQADDWSLRTRDSRFAVRDSRFRIHGFVIRDWGLGIGD